MTAAGRAVTLVIDCCDLRATAGFWQELLGLAATETTGDRWTDLEPLAPGGPVLAFQRVPEAKVAPNRLHLDIAVADLETAAERVRSLGGSSRGPVHGSDAPWRVMADVEGNEFCLVTA